MPKEKANEIAPNQSVEVGGRVFVPGDEDELAEVITAEQVAHLTKMGAVRGFKGAPSQASRDKAAKSATARGHGAGEDAEARKATREPLASVTRGESLTGDETAELTGGTPAGTPAKGVEPSGKSTARKSAKSDGFDPDKATIAELEERLGDDLPSKGTGSNGALTLKDLRKAYKKHFG